MRKFQQLVGDHSLYPVEVESVMFLKGTLVMALKWSADFLGFWRTLLQGQFWFPGNQVLRGTFASMCTRWKSKLPQKEEIVVISLGQDKLWGLLVTTQTTKAFCLVILITTSLYFSMKVYFAYSVLPSSIPVGNRQKGSHEAKAAHSYFP